MGQWKEVRSIRFGADDLRRVAELKDVFDPMWESFSEVVLGSLKMLHSQVVTPELLTGLGEALQRLQCHTAPEMRQEKPGPIRASRPTHNHGRPGLVSHQFTATSANAGSGPLKRYHAYQSHPFLGAVRLERRIA